MPHPCPACNHPSTNVNPGSTKHTKRGVVRRRGCSKCGTQIRTVQATVAGAEVLETIIKTAGQADDSRRLARQRGLILDLWTDIQVLGRWSPENIQRIRKEIYNAD